MGGERAERETVMTATVAKQELFECYAAKKDQIHVFGSQ